MLQIFKSLPYDILIPWPTDLKLTHSGKLDVCVTLGKLIQPVTWSLSFSFTSLGLGHRPSGKCWKWASFVVRTFQSIFGCQKLFCYYTLFFKFAVAVHEQTAAIIHGIKCDGRQSTKMMFRLLFFTGFPRLKKIGNCNNSRCREYIIVNRLRFALRLICKKISQPIETLQRGPLAQSLTWFNVNQEIHLNIFYDSFQHRPTFSRIDQQQPYNSPAVCWISSNNHGATYFIQPTM